jgi:hypothetical protein
MISIFNGQRHRLGEASKKEIYIEVGVALRDHLHCFTPAEFMVFMAIALHINADGESWPSYDQLQKDTGMHRATVAKAIKGLMHLCIDGNPILAVRRERNERGLLKGSNIYQVFPDSSVCRTFIPSNVHAVVLEEEPVRKEEPKRKKKNGGVTVEPTHDEPPPAPRPTAAALTESVTADGAESVILSALERLNQGIRSNGGGKVITGTQAIARRLAARGETVESMRTAWAACKANAANPIGAFVFWTKEQYTPPPKAGYETRTDEQGNRMVWIDGQGWMTIQRSSA